ncbi:MAG: 2-dehydropantoate 2-reductase N-terminal domain-containing protein, partial [Legionella sp.]|nr:2-dehydropantoate 2-reductase N-terminal domain-containing protein [Legionella sp.]
MSEPIFAVLGAGSWGTAVAMHLAMRGQRVYLWGRDGNHVHDMAKTRENTRYLPGIAFPDSLT